MIEGLDELTGPGRSVRPVTLGRLISAIERGEEHAAQIDRTVLPLAGGAHVVGITGAPGAGKSTLTGKLIGELRGREAKVAVLAVDPSSPLSGGAMLGDRVRMLEHSLDAGVFIRSMASRGRLGGLALAVPPAVRLLDAAGYEVILLETVGVGQAELDVIGVADTTMVLLTPGSGDEVQAAKAGLMEVADLFVINRADRAGAQDTETQVREMLRARSTGEESWTPPILQTVAPAGAGVTEVLQAIESHRRWLQAAGELQARRAARLWSEVEALVALRAAALAKARLGSESVGELRRQLTDRELDPWSAATRLLDATTGAPQR